MAPTMNHAVAEHADAKDSALIVTRPQNWLIEQVRTAHVTMKRGANQLIKPQKNHAVKRECILTTWIALDASSSAWARKSVRSFVSAASPTQASLSGLLKA